jgi:Tol biopolymer transport system component
MSPATPSKGGPDAPAVRAHLAMILGSPEFKRSERSRGLLEFIVESALTRRGEGLKESLIGIQIFGRPADYDPKIDPVVRVSVGRLRTKLDEYYLREARESVRISLPKGTYVPSFEWNAPLERPAPPPPPPGRSRTWKLAATGAGLLLAVAAAALVWLGTPRGLPAFDHLRPLLTSGGPNSPEFSPSGDMLAFDSEGSSDRHRNVYLQRLDSASPIRLTHDESKASNPTWSPDGSEIAFLRDTGDSFLGIFTIAPNGSGERKLLDLKKGAAPWLRWSPNGQWLVAAEPDAQGSRSLVRIAVRTGEKRYITNPPAGWRGDSLPVFAPDSASVAFRRTTALSGHEDVYTVPIGGGTVKRITFDDTGVSGVAFLNDGRLLVSSKREGPIRGLWCYGPGGKRSTRLTATTVDAGPAIVSRDGRRLALIAYSFDVNIWRVPAAGGAPATVLIASELPDSSPQYSPDGGRLAFCSMRSGSDGIWVSDSNGANETRLFDGKGMPVGAETWSPDGRQLAFEWHPTKNAEIHIMPAGGGRSRPLVVDQFNNRVPVWSHDGAFVYFASNRTGTWAIFQVPAAGGPLTQLTWNGASFAALSPTGDTLYSITEGAGPKGSGIRQLWRTSLHGGTPELVFGELVPQDWNNWVPVENGVYYMHRRKAQEPAIEYLDFATHKTRTVHELQKPPAWGGGMAISPDRKSLLFTQVDRDGSSLFVQ